MCFFYVVRVESPEDRAVVDGWDRASLSLDWRIDRDGDVPTLSLHGCDMVREWDRPSGWKLPKEHRSSLYSDLSKLFWELPGSLELTAIWSSDDVAQDVELARGDVLDRVLKNRIANRTLYRVRSEPALSTGASQSAEQ
jgi:hypothetical protein